MADAVALPTPDPDSHHTNPDVPPARKPRPAKKRFRVSKRARAIVAVVILCVASSILSTWLLLATGILRPDATHTIVDNREKLVLQQGEIVADVFKKVSPATVSITTESRAASSRFFEQSDVEQGAGSGIIISKDGYVLTNKHVIPTGTERVSVILADGRELSNVTVVGRDPFNDIAFLKIQGETNLPFAKLGDSGTVTPGQQVVAIGNALGEFRNSVTSGIISGIGRPIEAADGAGTAEKLENLLQTDAAINPGNSGGPLVNLKGEVIGINTAIAQEAQAIGFAIPINDAKGLIKTVQTQGKLVKPYLGVRYTTLNTEIAKQLGLSVTHGAYVSGDGSDSAIVPGSPAEKAGIKNGDIITAINGKQVGDTSTLASLLAQYAPGDKIEVTLLRNNKEQTVEVTLEAYPQT